MKINLNLPDYLNEILVRAAKEDGISRQSLIVLLLKGALIRHLNEGYVLATFYPPKRKDEDGLASEYQHSSGFNSG